MEILNTIRCRFGSLALLVIRLTVGTIFIQSGYGKLTHLAQTTDYFASLHIPMPHVNAIMASATELVGGILMVLGLFTPLAAIPLTFVMIIAIVTAKLPDVKEWGDFIRLQEWDYILFFALLFAKGAGRYSLDTLIFKGASKGKKKK